jgi:hypothetical protein
MDVEDIKRLAHFGMGAFPPRRLDEAAAWLSDYAEASGDARYSSLAATVKMIVDTFEAQSEQMLKEFVEQLDALLSSQVPEILESRDAVSASALARDLREEVSAVLADHTHAVDRVFGQPQSKAAQDDPPGHPPPPP